MTFTFPNLELIDTLYQEYQANPASVEPSWRHFFEGWEAAGTLQGNLAIFRLIAAYRTYGHLAAQVNPIAVNAPTPVPELALETYGLSTADLSRSFPTEGLLEQEEAPLSQILEALQRTYATTVGIEYMGLRVPGLEKWMQERVEPQFLPPFSHEEKSAILHELNKAELFETFLHTKYVGQKRFSLEGAETLIPMLSAILEEDPGEVVIGMAHRGRLNVLANILNKSFDAIFSEFEDHYTPDMLEGTGDVKYHKGFAGKFTTKKGKEIDVTLCANPSHLESVDPVVEGQVRAKQEIKKETLPILIHGDAALAGQGVVYETMQFGKLSGYATGGTLHIVINNQIGFTTLPKEARSTYYCTDIARAFDAPVFHVNAERPEECVHAAKLALAIRQTFHCDVFLDLNCYRKYGHNEGDEPAFTQPIEYQRIRQKKSIRTLYRDTVVDPTTAATLEAEFTERLSSALERVAKAAPTPEKAAVTESVATTLSKELLTELAEDFCHPPADLHLHPKVKKLLEERLQMVQGKIDWGMGETLAYATLLSEGIPIRISGQDVQRGTFSHRHAILIDQEKEAIQYCPLDHLKKAKAPFAIYNSSLSEFAVLAFEFGYTLSAPRALVIWEAQFGDFANSAQVVIDQYIAASEQKWGVRSNITLFLPHGYEGQGPEHSSARIERYLQQCAQDNLFVLNCTTPAQLFHALRRQALYTRKKPLILFTPKALLRHPECVSTIADFTEKGFEEFLVTPAENPRRILFCTGKVYYDLLEKKPADIAIVRVEQLYPFAKEKFGAHLAPYKNISDYAWVQEEPRNMGAWNHIRPLLEENLGKTVRYVGREESAAPAVGSHKAHKQQLARYIEEAFA